MSLWRKRKTSDTNCDTIAPNVHHNGQNQPKWFNMTALANNDLSIKSEDLSIKLKEHMTQDEIIEMAKQAGFDPHDMSSDFTCNLENINAFAKLVAEKEREAYPEGDVVGPCICGSWPGGKCLKCPRIAPPQRTWVGLTDEDFYGQSELQRLAMKYAEAKLKEKNT
jgi:hypothetical protein